MKALTFFLKKHGLFKKFILNIQVYYDNCSLEEALKYYESCLRITSGFSFNDSIEGTDFWCSYFEDFKKFEKSYKRYMANNND